jgi:molecular chaperone DnaK
MDQAIGIVVFIIIVIAFASVALRNYQIRHGKVPGSRVVKITVPHSEYALLVSISTETMGGLLDTIFEAGTTLPQSKERIYTTTADGQRTVEVRILQGFRLLAEHNEVLVEFQVTGIPLYRRGIPKIKVTLQIDEQGVLTVSAFEEFSGQTPRMVVLSSEELTAEQVKNMKREAAQCAQKDAQQVSLIKTQNQAALMIYAAKAHIPSYVLARSGASKIKTGEAELESVRTNPDEQVIIAAMDALQIEMEVAMGERYNRERGFFGL